jgi:hypothetical protein
MTRSRIIFVAAFVLVAAFAAAGQSVAGPIKSSAAYAEVALRKAELQADLESFLADYTEANPKIVDIRTELTSINRSLERIYAVAPSDTGKLTAALGKMIVKKAALDAELARLQRTYGKEHVEVKRAQRRVDSFDSAINEILR